MDVSGGTVDIDYTGSDAPDLISVLTGNGDITARTLGGDDGVWAYASLGRIDVDLGEGDDVAGGGDADDILRGGPGVDGLNGWDGDDVVDGGSGIVDSLDGGDGIDTGIDPDQGPGEFYCLDIEIGFCAETP